MKSKEIEICRNAFSLAQRNLEKSQKQTEVFKNLQKIIPAEILEQIESPKKPLHCIFVISSDFDLVAGIASYIYHVYASGSFTHLSYSGYTDQQIISDLFPPSPPNKFRLDHYLKGRTLFISGLGNNHRLVFKRLLGVFREINFSNPYKKEFGFLIISVEDIALIPQELMNLSDMIGIKSAKKDLPASTQQDIQKITALFYDDAKSILFLDDEKCCELTKDEQALVDYLRQDSQHFSDIITHFQSLKEYSNTNWSRGNFDNLQSDLKRKTVKELGVKLIQNLKRGSGKYGLFVKIKDKKFKK